MSRSNGRGRADPSCYVHSRRATLTRIAVVARATPNQNRQFHFRRATLTRIAVVAHATPSQNRYFHFRRATFARIAVVACATRTQNRYFHFRRATLTGSRWSRSPLPARLAASFHFRRAMPRTARSVTFICVARPSHGSRRSPIPTRTATLSSGMECSDLR